MKTTLNKIRKYEPCAAGWQKLLTYLGKAKADDEPLSIATILDSNGLDDALWCLRAVEGYDREIRLYAVWCARQVQHLMKDQRSLDALDVAEQYALGKATDAELAAVRDAAMDAWAAVRDVVRPAGSSGAAARYAAANAAANAATTIAAADAAAAWAAAWYAARAAAWAVTRSAAGAYATEDAAREKQGAELRRICGEG